MNDSGEVRVVPYCDNGNLILCRNCFIHEMNWRREQIFLGRKFDIPIWSSLALYPD
ncbi:MAG: hypothetical protein WC942_07350 [Clostridia bacterium]